MLWTALSWVIAGWNVPLVLVPLVTELSWLVHLLSRMWTSLVASRIISLTRSARSLTTVAWQLPYITFIMIVSVVIAMMLTVSGIYRACSARKCTPPGVPLPTLSFFPGWLRLLRSKTPQPHPL